MKVLIFDLTYLIAIVFLGMCIYNGEKYIDSYLLDKAGGFYFCRDMCRFRDRLIYK